MIAPLFYDATGKRPRWLMRARNVLPTAALCEALHRSPASVFARFNAITGALGGLWVGPGWLGLNGKFNAAQWTKGA